MVTGQNRSYLWILARTKTLPEDTLNALIEKAKRMGFATNKLIMVEHGP
jgi:apolipoprotein D and lipocalin family protein